MIDYSVVILSDSGTPHSDNIPMIFRKIEMYRYQLKKFTKICDVLKFNFKSEYYRNIIGMWVSTIRQDNDAIINHLTIVFRKVIILVRKKSGALFRRVRSDKQKSGALFRRVRSDKQKSGAIIQRVGSDKQKSSVNFERVGSDKTKSGVNFERVGSY